MNKNYIILLFFFVLICGCENTSTSKFTPLKQKNELQQLVNHGDKEAQYKLGMILTDYGLTQDDIDKANSLLYNASFSIPYANIILARNKAREYDEEGANKLFEDNLEKITNMSSNGDAEATYVLARAVATIEDNKSKALNLYKKAAELNHPGAYRFLGNTYRSGLFNEDKNPVKAAEYYSKGAQYDDAISQYYLGTAYIRGDGVKEDKKEAQKLIEAAAQQGYSRAQILNGISYFHGSFLDRQQDLSQGFSWFKKAADLDNILAKLIVSACYAKGFGVDKDVSLAKKYFKEATGIDNSDIDKAFKEFSNSIHADPQLLIQCGWFPFSINKIEKIGEKDYKIHGFEDNYVQIVNEIGEMKNY